MRTRKPARTKERYILDSLVSVFRGGHWVEDTVGSLVDEPEDSTSTAYITVIGGQKYDSTIIRHIPLDHTIVVGAGRGVESDLLKWSEDSGEVIQLEPDPDLFGKNARKVNVEQVLCFAPDSPLLLVGDGTRVKQARAWLDRTKSKREVIELP